MPISFPVVRAKNINEYHLATRRGEPIHLDVTLPEMQPGVKDVFQRNLGDERFCCLEGWPLFPCLRVCVCVVFRE